MLQFDKLKCLYETIPAPGAGSFAAVRKALPSLRNKVWALSFVEAYPTAFPNANGESVFMGISVARDALTARDWLKSTNIWMRCVGVEVVGGAGLEKYIYPIMTQYNPPIPIFSESIQFWVQPYTADSGAQFRIGIIPIDVDHAEKYVESGSEP